MTTEATKKPRKLDYIEQVQQTFQTIQGSKKCGQSGDICKILRMSLNMAESRKGIVFQLVCNLKTGKSRRQLYYFGGDFKHGIVLNNCPFCGGNPPEMADK